MSRVFIIVFVLLIPLLLLATWDAIEEREWIWGLANIGMVTLLVTLIVCEVRRNRALEKR